MYGRISSEFIYWGNSPKEDSTMLNITRSSLTLKKELRSAKGLIKDILGTLDSLTPRSNLCEKVGIFILQIPDYKVLAKDAEDAKQLLRKVCSGELKVPEAIAIFSCAYDEVKLLLDTLEDYDGDISKLVS